ncbi:glutaredoxin family protein [Paraoerskovia sediminicola]|nr:glutaredoxin family protein [Paraoerskovia sediminicola]
MTTGDPSGRAPRVLLYSRAACHLCDEARDVVVQVCSDAGESFDEIDIDAPGADPALREEHGEHVPVVLVDGRQQGFWRVDAGRLARALARGARPR